MARFQHRPMQKSVRLLVLFLAAQYMLDSSDDLLDLLVARADPGMGRFGPGPLFWQPNYANSTLFWAISAIRPPLFTNLDTRSPLFTNPASAPVVAPLFFRHTNRHRINGRKQRDREREIQFLCYHRAIELHHYAILGLHVLEADGVPIDRQEVKSTSWVFGNGPVQTSPLLEFFEMTLDYCSKPQEILGFQLGHLMANYSRIHLPECVHKVLMTVFMLEFSTSQAGESPCGHDYCITSVVIHSYEMNTITIPRK